MSIRALLIYVLACSASVQATVSIATKNIGGPGAFSSCGTQTPPVLCDGDTEARTEVRFTFDDVAMTLTLRVTNTSPVERGVPNPVLTNLYFNVPAAAITGMTLFSQQGSGGAAPTWTLSFDNNIFQDPNPNTTSPYGSFNARLINPSGNLNGIANANADTLGVPPGTAVTGPVTFVLNVTPAAGARVNASTFANAFSYNGDKQVNVVGRYQAGGPALSTGKISNAPSCGPGAFIYGEPRIGRTITFAMGGQCGCHGCLVISVLPGPTVFPGNLILPIGMPFAVIIPQMDLPATNLITANVTIPNEPALVNTRIYGAVIILSADFTRIEFSTQFDFTILP